MLQQDGRVAWPQVECSVPVCAVQPASASRLQCWHAQWDLWTKGHTEAVGLLADKMEALLKEAQQGTDLQGYPLRSVPNTGTIDGQVTLPLPLPRPLTLPLTLRSAALTALPPAGRARAALEDVASWLVRNATR